MTTSKILKIKLKNKRLTASSILEALHTKPYISRNADYDKRYYKKNSP